MVSRSGYRSTHRHQQHRQLQHGRKPGKLNQAMGGRSGRAIGGPEYAEKPRLCRAKGDIDHVLEGKISVVALFIVLAELGR